MSDAAEALERLPWLGVGVAYRPPFRQALLEGRLPVQHVELAIEYTAHRGCISDTAMRLKDLYPLILHGVSQSVGSPTYCGRDRSYEQTRDCVAALSPLLVGEHLSFSGHGSFDAMQLLPLPRTPHAASAAAARARAFQAVHGLPMVLEYIACHHDPGGDLTEADFLRLVLDLSGCGLLLDLHNVYTNALNRRIDPLEILSSLPIERTVQVHLAGGEWVDGRYLDSHSAPVPEIVWELFARVLRRTRPRSVILERDAKFPPVEELGDELERAGALWARAEERAAEPPAASPPDGLSAIHEAHEAPEIEALLRAIEAHPPRREPGSLTSLYARIRRAKFQRALAGVLKRSSGALEPYITSNIDELITSTSGEISPLGRAEAIQGRLRAALPEDRRWELDVDMAVASLAYRDPAGGPSGAEATRIVPCPGDALVRVERGADGRVSVIHLRRPQGGRAASRA